MKVNDRNIIICSIQHFDTVCLASTAHALSTGHHKYRIFRTAKEHDVTCYLMYGHYFILTECVHLRFVVFQYFNPRKHLTGPHHWVFYSVLTKVSFSELSYYCVDILNFH